MRFKQIVSTMTPFDKFIGDCLMSSTLAHSAHFETKSYARHMAYKYFYEEMPEKIDAFVETYIASGFQYQPSLEVRIGMDFDTFVANLADTAEAVAKKAPNKVLENAADDIQLVCRQTMYKLTLS